MQARWREGKVGMHLAEYHNDQKLLKERCQAILEDIAPGRVRPYRNLFTVIALDSGAMRRIGLAPKTDAKGAWDIQLVMYPGDTIEQARDFFTHVRSDAFLSLQKRGWKINPNLHFSFMSRHLHWANTSLPLKQYVEFWQSGTRPIQQTKRDVTDFRQLFNELMEARLITAQDVQKLETHFSDTDRQTINVCPGIGLAFQWSREEACALDFKSHFCSVVEGKIHEALATWGQPLRPERVMAAGFIDDWSLVRIQDGRIGCFTKLPTMGQVKFADQSSHDVALTTDLEVVKFPVELAREAVTAFSLAA
jgi:hypothetical protein